ncbi:hypothetical protein BWQ96_05088 [Gracilariopsis chorda]|uniref:protein-tyrosine-phosphatase n=1 Tax=Gracilariopsis chorda TaxID=448386 RepID=A0A2V3ITY1_9FLOR|nr:hypothetical protein BWQ96_05088 [Gracilariopsis chorda]|eukprot:PXF45187.1 hypothetical protein BWQ96_05088 [Gracilariopsis chorda]
MTPLPKPNEENRTSSSERIEESQPDLIDTIPKASIAKIRAEPAIPFRETAHSSSPPPVANSEQSSTKQNSKPAHVLTATPADIEVQEQTPVFNGLASGPDLPPDYCYVSVGGSLIPPTNFGIVEEDLYRSGMPNELNFPFLERLQLRTIIYLASDEVSDKLLDFIDDQGIELMHLAQDDEIPTPWKPISEETVLSAMELLLNTSTYPVFIMCSQGRHRTGTVVGCLRKLQRWSLSSIFEEYHRHADGKGRLVNEQFIELFDTDLINIPSTNIPKWLGSYQA